MKIFKSKTSNASFGYFWDGILKKYCHIWNQHPHVFLKAKFSEKMKMLNFRYKNALFGCFWAGT